MIQRKTQTLDYWQKQFSISQQDLEFIYNKILEENCTYSLDDIAIAIVQRHSDAEGTKNAVIDFHNLVSSSC